MERSETISSLTKALVKAQGAISPAQKDSANPHLRSKYASLTSVWEACREALTANGLAVIQCPVDGQQGWVTLETTLLHESGEFISSTFSMPVAKHDAQGYGAICTYLRRYALSALIGIVSDDDDDAQSQALPAGVKRGAPPVDIQAQRKVEARKLAKEVSNTAVSMGLNADGFRQHTGVESLRGLMEAGDVEALQEALAKLSSLAQGAA